MANQQKEQDASEQSSPGALLEKAQTNRVIISSSEGKTWVNLSVLVVVALTLILQEIVGLLVIVAFFKGGRIEIASSQSSKKADNSEEQEIA